MLYIVGLGAGDVGQMTMQVASYINGSYPLYLRTNQHPAVAYLDENAISYRNFDDIYQKHDCFEDVYAEIIDVLQLEKSVRDIVYAVPGHPCMAEYAVKVLMQEEDVKVIGGQSFLDAMFTALRIDPIEGFTLLDALSMKEEQLHPATHVIIAQIYDQLVASDVKLKLMSCYDDEHPVCRVHMAGSSAEQLVWTPLYEMDHDFVLDNTLSLYVPPLKE